jgi:DNA-binding Lrp family transcriptional regulator
MDQTDQRIFEQLAEDGRMSNLELARRLGVSEKTIRQRVRRLIDRDGLHIVATIDNQLAHSRAIFLVHTKPGYRFLVANHLANLPGVDEVHLGTGAYELIVQASFNSDAEALEFYVDQIESGNGIQDAQSTHIIQTIVANTDYANKFIEEFDARAEFIDELPALFDLAWDIATEHLGTHRITGGIVNASYSDPDSPLFATNIRARGMSSRYIDALCVTRRSDSVIVPTVIERGQHLFVPDAQTDPLFRSIADLVVSEGFHSFLAVPMRSDAVSLGTMNLYFDTVIPYSPELVANAQELADALGKHIARVTDSERRLVTDPA